ncbi:MAG: peptidyl-prolyl cis-trans isomerase [Candidatus Omnitrophica bacterium]|nr:peptidyl-prolyl cis-trans isomerase [Candidatus Omnitrophota bacterium]
MKRSIITLMFTVYLVALFAGGCGGRGDNEVLARIDNKETITVGDFNNRIKRLPERYQEVINQNKKAFLDELIIDAILHKEALNQKLYENEEVKGMVGEATKKILIARLLKEEVGDKVTVTEEEIEAYYSKNNEQFTAPEMLRASHILVKTEKEAKDILAELANGRNFEDLAKARSMDSSAKIGGDIGSFTRQQLVPEFEEASFNLQVGEISGIVKTKFGYHIIKLTERKEPRVKELAEVRDAIEQSHKRQKGKQRFQEFVEDLKEKSKITVNTDLLESISTEEAPKEKPEE